VLDRYAANVILFDDLNDRLYTVPNCRPTTNQTCLISGKTILDTYEIGSVDPLNSILTIVFIALVWRIMHWIYLGFLRKRNSN
jgi:hypothetical protein